MSKKERKKMPGRGDLGDSLVSTLCLLNTHSVQAQDQGGEVLAAWAFQAWVTRALGTTSELGRTGGKGDLGVEGWVFILGHAECLTRGSPTERGSPGERGPADSGKSGPKTGERPED